MDSEPQDQRLVKFKQLDGSIIELTVQKDITFAELKSKVKDQAKLSEDQIRFIFKAKSPQENQKLSDLITEDGQTIHLVKKAAPQPAAEPTQAQGSSWGSQQPGSAQQAPPNLAAMMGAMGGPQGARQGGPPPNLAAMMGAMGGGPGAAGPGARAGGPPPNLAAMLGAMGGGQGAAGPGARAGGPPPNLAAMLGAMGGGPGAAGPGARAGGPPPNLAAMLGAMGGGQAGRPGQGAGGGPPGQPPNLAAMLGAMGAGQPRRAGAPGAQGAPGQPGQPQQIDINNIMSNVNQLLGSLQPPQVPQPSQPAQAAPQQEESSGQNGGTAIQLPHQVLFRVGQMCNHMYGGNFPGPSMPQLQVDRNLSVLLGSYLCNLNMQLQRLSPLMQRCGDLMQRESQITNEAERKLTQELAGNIGKCLEDISRATGSVAHMYKTVEMGGNGSAVKCKVNEFDQTFAKMIEEVGSVQSRGSASQAEEAKGEAQEDAKDVILEVQEKLTKPDMIKFFQGKYDELDHLTPIMYDVFDKQIKRLGSNDKLAQEYSSKLQSMLSNDGEGVKESLHEGFDPIVNCDDVAQKCAKKLIELSMSKGRTAKMAELTESFKEAMTELLYGAADETQDGFVNGEADFMKWLKSNISRINMEGVPDNQKMMANMKTAMMCGQIQGLLNKRKESVPQPVQPTPPVQAAAQAAPQQPVDPTEQQRMQLKRKYEAVIKADKEKMTQTQGPLSRAYLSTSSFAKSQILSKEEEKISTLDYHTDKQKKLDGLKPEPKVRDAIRRNLITGGGFPQAKVESVMQNIPALPDDLVEAYLKMQKSTIKYRLVDDEDFKAALEEGDQIKKDQFKNLTNL